MKVILDEGVPRPLARQLEGHDVETVPEVGWAGVKNGALLKLIEEAGYRAFLSCDKNIPAQQGELHKRPFAVLILSTNHYPTMRPHVKAIRDALYEAEPGTVTAVECGTFVPKRFRNPQP